MLLSMVIYKQAKKIESTRAFNERTMLILWLVLGMVGLISYKHLLTGMMISIMI